MNNCDVVILGAGPYGLAVGAHLRNIKGLDVRVFGEPMDFWKSHMPEGMFLRSPWAASHISDPNSSLTLDSFCAATGESISKPIPLDRFVDYGLWFQSQAVPEVDRRRIQRIDKDANGLRLTLEDGEQLTCRRVVVAAGISTFARRLPQFEGIPSDFVTHASYGRDVRRFAGKRVAVIGAGQSALESAALIHEAGAEVEVIVRQSSVHWLGWRARMQKLGPIAKLLYSPHDIGPAGISRIVSQPQLMKYFPRVVQTRFRTRALRPAGARWLTGRFKNIPITLRRQVASAAMSGDRLHLRLDDGGTRDVDHVVLGTGYKIGVSRYPFLPSELSTQLDQENGFVKVNEGFESSVPGLHFLGAPSAWRFGPLMFFVCGTDFAARRLAQYISSTGTGPGRGSR
jgi:cation diffusion facilitator CzcD-associated flavoprotein CzcO